MRGSALPILGVVLFAAVVLAGCASTHRTPAGAAPPHVTATRTFHAYDAKGELAVKVGDVASGNCWTTSIAAPVAGAYRCLAGDHILDPCFAPPSGSSAELACLAAPWSDALVLHLTRPLPKAEAVDDVGRAWAFELDNGVRCVASTGTVPAVQGVNLAYRCTDGYDAALLDTSAPQVTADYGKPASQTLQPVTVTTIWQG